MKKSLQILTYFFLFTQTSLAQIYTVKQNGTGDYTSIQPAVDAASNGDTVLVWPGIYYENIAIEGKHLCLGSLTLTSGDNSYINQTIINGNQTGSCIKLDECPDTCLINGFTLTNGSGTWHGDVVGGGMFIKETNVKLLNCNISNNKVTGRAGGIYLKNANLFLSGSTISNNQAYNCGGGIVPVYSTLKFDSIHKCNIYLNYAAYGTDICKGTTSPSMHVIVDTFTVSDPDYYYLFSSNGYGYPNDDITSDIGVGKIQQTVQNLYVANSGDNNNSGLSPDVPLKTISFSLLKMASDSISPDTIHIANGTYAPSSGEMFPLSLKKYVSIRGNDFKTTILDAESQTYILYGILFGGNFKISNLTITNGKENSSSSYFGAYIFIDNDNTVLENLLFTNNRGGIASYGTFNGSNNVLFNNVDFIGNIGGPAFRTGTTNVTEKFSDTVYLINCRFINNQPDYADPEIGLGGGAAVLGQDYYPDSMTCIFTNCLFEHNHSKQHPYGGYAANALGIAFGAQAYVVNCTFSDNSSENPTGASIGVTSGSKLHLYNSIMYNNMPAELYMANTNGIYDCKLNIYNSLIDGGEEGIRIYSDGNNIFYDNETNIDTDPFFLNKWEHPYQIADGSPCIDAGTLASLPDFIELPEYDLAGNPRIVGDSIDMGAYEWNPTVGIDKHQYQPIKNNKPKLLQAAPNPFAWETTISANWDFIGHVQIEIYNNAGLRVKVLKSGRSGGKGSIQTKWDGKDENNNILPTGIYHIVMFWEGKEIDGIKVVKM